MNAATSRRIAWAALGAACLVSTSAWAETVRGSGNVRSEARQVSGFTGIGLGIPAKVDVKTGPVESVTVEADDNLLPLIETRLKGSTLEIRPVRDQLSLDSKSIRVTVQARAIDKLAIGGSGDIHAGTLRTPSMKIEIGGSGSVDLKRLDSDKVEVAIGGSGNVNLAGTAKKLEAKIGGSGNVTAPEFVADDATVIVAGSGDAKLGVRSTLGVTVVGAGSIGYYGDPRLSRTVVGSGVVKRLGALPQP